MVDDFSEDDESSVSENEQFEIEPSTSGSRADSSQSSNSNENYAHLIQNSSNISNLDITMRHDTKTSVSTVINKNIEKTSTISNPVISHFKAHDQAEPHDLSKHLHTSLKISLSEHKNSEKESNHVLSIHCDTPPSDSSLTLVNNKLDSISNSQDLVLFRSKDNEVPKSKDNIENICITNSDQISKQEPFSLYNLIKEHSPLQSSKIVVNRYHSNGFRQINPMLDDSYYVVTTLLR